MNTRIKPVVFSISLAITGCAGINQKSRIGENDGSDPCYLHLKAVDDIAIYYKDDRTETIAEGAFGGLLAGAQTGAVVGKGNKKAVVGGATIGAVAGGFLANAYWENKMQQAHNAKSQAIAMVEQDLQEDVERMNQLDSGVRSLVRCRMQRRDQIRKDYAGRRITREQAQVQWAHWGENMNKDLEEMTYLNDALNNMEKMEQSYEYALNAIEGDENTNYNAENYDYDADIDEGQSSSRKVNKQQRRTASSHKATSKTSKSAGNTSKKQGRVAQQKQKASGHKPKSRVGSLVAARHEKLESVKKGKDQMTVMAAEGANKNGFEQMSLWQINQSPLAALDESSYPGVGLSCSAVPINSVRVSPSRTSL